MSPIRIAAIAALAAVVFVTDIEWTPTGPALALLGAPAFARIGHPLTPLSYAGVARRTTRRAVRRTAIVMSTLPGGCHYGNYYGGYYYNCGGVYYQRSGSTYVQVIIE